MEPHERLKQARIAAGFENAVDAARRFSWNEVTYRAHENGIRGLTRKNAAPYAKAFKVSAAWLLTGEAAPRFVRSPPQIPLMGCIGAGGEIEAVDSGNLGTVEAPPDADEETVAAEVRGLSMTPAYEDGTVLYWSRTVPPETMINRRCVVQLADGRIMVKILRAGSTEGLWRLESINPAFPAIEDQAVAWVAKIDWTKPR